MLTFAAKEFKKGKVCIWTGNGEEKNSITVYRESYTQFLTERNTAEDDGGSSIRTFTIAARVDGFE